MTTAEVIDRIITPIAGGFGVFLAFRLSKGGKNYPVYISIMAGFAAALIMGTIKFIY